MLLSKFKSYITLKKYVWKIKQKELKRNISDLQNEKETINYSITNIHATFLFLECLRNILNPCLNTNSSASNWSNLALWLVNEFGVHIGNTHRSIQGKTFPPDWYRYKIFQQGSNLNRTPGWKNTNKKKNFWKLINKNLFSLQ